MYFHLVCKIHVDNLINKPLPGELKVVALDLHEHEPAGLVQGLEADPVLGVERRLPERERMAWCWKEMA